MKKEKLINKIAEQLRNSGYYESINIDKFDDGSAYWIDAHKKLEPEDGVRYLECISFNGKGTKMTDIAIYEEKRSWDDNCTKIV